MIEEKLYLIQEELNDKLLNTDAKLLDINSYTLLLNQILDSINLIFDNQTHFSFKNTTNKFNSDYIIIKSNDFNNSLNGYLLIYLIISNDKIVRIEPTILTNLAILKNMEVC
ncbi:hypothetical protein [Clostridium beijerinckii]|uniref:Uncharacterized protein n=1 Tax=Clostridium beijerinckii TaxID=1520 RepID=A0AAW3W3S3_CLOBE|nr:hypothetical protein [Clostridium beijerinckii]MBC2455637.1 hypothetical protein [Clostridium beijerinckii]MBC2473114.1 hypothetical protein [Clostridium beijerinckii]NOV62382.1 hypothetical protein [Clostridium beijerinckii]NOV68121.1 hypothetical protein [Clostridium beijerinckii]NOW30434.1 hypothetical protein [Clostridium beijerinckii]